MLTAVDEALLLYIASKFTITSPNIVCAPESIALREISERRGKVYLPFYSFWRTGIVEAKNRIRTPVAIDSQLYELTDSMKSWSGLKGVPVDLEYELWIWAGEDGRRDINTALELYEFFKFENPRLFCTSDQGIQFGFPMIFGDPRDESLLADKYRIGEVHRYVFPFKIEGWVFKGMTWKAIKKIFIDFYNGEYPDKSDFLFELEYDIPGA